MATVAQRNLFSWKEIDTASDLDRLRLVLMTIPDEQVMCKLERARGKGRDDYPVRAIWNSVLAGVVYEHLSIESLRRELGRNGELRELCGFDPLAGAGAVPTPRSYTNFFLSLFKCAEEIDQMFDALLEDIKRYLPDLGKNLAADSKAINSAGKPNKKDRDGRRETDADWGSKTYQCTQKGGSLWTKVKSWFGFKLHLVVDADYELPVAWDVTRASQSDTTHLLPMMKDLKQKHPTIIECAEHMFCDKGYDSAQNNRELFAEFGIKPLIDTRQMWKDGEQTRPLFSERVDNIVYDERGGVYCVATSRDDARQCEMKPMAFDGFEANRGTLKYRCPVAVYGLQCAQRCQCGGVSQYGRVVRVPLKTDHRIFVPVPRDSNKWDRLYAKRSAVERVNSRLDVSFGFERHFIRGLKKMKARVGIALVVMLAMALGSIKSGQKERMRSLVKPVRLPEAA